MKVSEYISLLNDFKRHFGDVEIEFWLRAREKESGEEIDPIELDLHEIHDGYNSCSAGNTETVCEIRLRDID